MSTPIYDQMCAERLMIPDPPTAPDPDAEATGPSPVVLDAQSRAYREMPPEAVVADAAIPYFTVRAHDPLAIHPADVLRLPEDYEADGWDTGREDPR